MITSKEKAQKDGKLCIYKIENLLNGKMYVGSGFQYRRKGQHLWKLRNNLHDSAILQKEWNEHGESNFLFSVLEYVDISEKRFEREQYYIDLLNVTNSEKGYNKAPLAGTNLGRMMSEESKRKMSIAKKGSKQNPEKARLRGLKQRKIILQYDLNDNFIKEFTGLDDAAKEINKDRTNISKALKGVIKSSGGFKWKYKEL